MRLSSLMNCVCAFGLATFVTSAHSALPAKGRLSAILQSAVKAGICEAELKQESVLESFSPDFTLNSSRLELVAINPSDEIAAQRVTEILTTPENMEMSGDFLNAGTVRRILAYGRSHPKELQENSFVNFAITLNGEIIGFSQLAKTSAEAAAANDLVTKPTSWFEISYSLDTKAWGKGYASEIAKTLIDYAMKEGSAEGVHAQTILTNDGSGGVLKKAGMREIERRRFASPSGNDGAIYYAITRKQWENPPQIGGFSIKTEIVDGQELIVMRVTGEVETFSVVRVEKSHVPEDQPLPKLGKDRFVMLKSTSDNNDYYGINLSVPKANSFGGPIFTSTVELDRIVRNSSDEDVGPRSRALAAYLEGSLGLSEMRGLDDDLASVIPENFLDLTIFEKRRVYEEMAKVVAAFKGQMQFQPLRLVVLNSAGADILTRKSYAQQPN